MRQRFVLPKPLASVASHLTPRFLRATPFAYLLKVTTTPLVRAGAELLAGVGQTAATGGASTLS